MDQNGTIKATYTVESFKKAFEVTNIDFYPRTTLDGRNTIIGVGRINGSADNVKFINVKPEVFEQVMETPEKAAILEIESDYEGATRVSHVLCMQSKKLGSL